MGRICSLLVKHRHFTNNPVVPRKWVELQRCVFEDGIRTPRCFSHSVRNLQVAGVLHQDPAMTGVTSRLNYTGIPPTRISVCVRYGGVSPRLSARSSSRSRSSYYTSLDRLEECPAIPQPFDPIFPTTTLRVLLFSFLAGIFGSRIERVPDVATGARPAVVLAGRPTAVESDRTRLLIQTASSLVLNPRRSSSLCRVGASVTVNSAACALGATSKSPLPLRVAFSGGACDLNDVVLWGRGGLFDFLPHRHGDGFYITGSVGQTTTLLRGAYWLS